nr:reverse transcriptase domain-containing protein [Tanacetum cinerariifolium]
MHILNDPSFFLTNKTGAPQGEELGLMKPLSERSCSCSNNSFISDGANRYGARATRAAPGIKPIWNSTGRAGRRPGKSSGNTSGKSQTIERKTNNKRKADDSFRNNHGHQQQQPVKRQNVTKIYNIGSGERKPYRGNLLKCTKCHLHHNGPCTQKCHKCNKIGHFARDCRSFGNANVANAQRNNGANPKGNGCFECGDPRHFKRDCPKLKNKDGGNVKFSTCTLLDAALTWWNSHIRSLGPDAYSMTWEVLKKKITDKYCPQGEIKKLEIELWNLKVKGNDVPAYTKCFQELTLICTKFVANETEKID